MSNLDLYNQRKANMKSGDCLLWRSSSVVGWLIRLFTSHTVNHARIVIRPHDYGHFKNRRFTIEALENGIILRLLSERLRNFNGKVWLYPLRDEYDFARELIVKWAIEKEGTPYDYGSLFKQIFGRVSAVMKQFFCSEFCYIAWKESGIPVNEEKAPRPGDIPALDIFKEQILIFE